MTKTSSGPIDRRFRIEIGNNRANPRLSFPVTAENADRAWKQHEDMRLDACERMTVAEITARREVA